MTTQELAYIEVEKLVKSFKNMPSSQRRGMNEMQTRLGYILPLFKALGWDTSNINEVSPEEKVSRGWVDFSFRIGNVPRFFLETKRVNEDLNDPKWVKQAIDYAWTKSVTWALLSDFEGLRVFNAEWKESNPFSAPRNLYLHDIAQIVVPLLANKGLFALLPDSKADFCLMASGGFSISVLNKEISPSYMLGLLNSKLLFWCLTQISNVFRGGWITCTKQYVGQLPIHRIDFGIASEKSAYDEVVRLVEKMLALQKERQSVRREDDLDRVRNLERQIAQVDAEIDQRVYALYGLTEEEIKLVEGG